HGITSLACRCGNNDCEAATTPRPVPETIIYALTDHTTTNTEPAAPAGGAESVESQPEDATPVKESPEGAGAETDTAAEGRPEPAPAPAPVARPRRNTPALVPGRSGYLFGSGFLPAPF
ncbi:hypothetical protein BST38_28920, partial [Mycolicibacterium parafortuitum]